MELLLADQFVEVKSLVRGKVSFQFSLNICFSYGLFGPLVQFFGRLHLQLMSKPITPVLGIVSLQKSPVLDYLVNVFSLKVLFEL